MIRYSSDSLLVHTECRNTVQRSANSQLCLSLPSPPPEKLSHVSTISDLALEMRPILEVYHG